MVFYVFDNKKNQQNNKSALFLGEVIRLTFIDVYILIHKNCTDQELIKSSLFRVNYSEKKALK
jgi:hypothetical protein